MCMQRPLFKLSIGSILRSLFPYGAGHKDAGVIVIFLKSRAYIILQLYIYDHVRPCNVLHALVYIVRSYILRSGLHTAIVRLTLLLWVPAIVTPAHSEFVTTNDPTL